MSEELYVNKRGFKCVRSQLAKTNGRDPQEHQAALSYAEMTAPEDRDQAWVKDRNDKLAALKVVAPEFQ